MIRIFVGIAFDPPVKDALHRHALSLMDAGLSGSFTKRDNFHLTLRFLGEVEERRIPEVIQAMEIAAGSAKSFSIEFRSVSTFGENGIFYLPAEETGGDGRLHALYSSLSSHLPARGFPPEGRPYRPHVTVARRGRVAGKITDLAENVRVIGVSQHVDRMTLFESRRGSEGMEYIEISGQVFGPR